jgi:hypothetical protein
MVYATARKYSVAFAGHSSIASAASLRLCSAWLPPDLQLHGHLDSVGLLVDRLNENYRQEL